MNSKKILEGDISELKVSSLPTRPTAPSSHGGLGFTATDMKEAFDKLPLFIIERLNTLLDDIAAEPDESVAAEIKTGISDGHTLKKLFLDILSGSFASYLSVGGESLAEFKARVDSKLA